MKFMSFVRDALSFVLHHMGSQSEASLVRIWWGKTGSVAYRESKSCTERELFNKSEWERKELGGLWFNAKIKDIRLQEEESKEHMVNSVHW